MVPSEDSLSMIMPDNSWTNTEADHVLLVNHNEKMERVLNDFTHLVGEFRVDVKSTAIKQEKDDTLSRKRNFGTI
jgi:hypothetical protein